MSVEVVCGDVFAADLPLGEARLVYADPPYLQEDRHGYGVAPDQEQLLRRMLELGADDAAFVLHTGAPQLPTLLPLVERLAPDRTRSYEGQPKAKLLVWVKPWRRGFRDNVSFWGMWEPIVLFYGRGYRHPKHVAEADWICALNNQKSLGAHATQKPDEVVEWLFERILHDRAERRLAVDLYAGTGGAAVMAHHRYRMDAIAVERDPDFCATISDRSNSYVRSYGPPLAVAVTVNGRPLWPTLGAITLPTDQEEPHDLTDDLQPVRRLGVRT